MTTNVEITRRGVLTVGAAGAGALVLAACGSGGADGGVPIGKGTASGQSDAAPAGQALARLADIPVGQAVAASLRDGSPVLVAQPAAGVAACFSAICTHMGCTVAPAGKQLHCPCHGSVYDAATGAVLHGPAPRPLAAVPVHVEDGAVITGATA